MNHVDRTVGPVRGKCDNVMGFHGLRPEDGWRINGHPARLLIWSPEEWERLDVRPIDALFHPFGVWCALRLVE